MLCLALVPLTNTYITDTHIVYKALINDELISYVFLIISHVCENVTAGARFLSHVDIERDLYVIHVQNTSIKYN